MELTEAEKRLQALTPDYRPHDPRCNALHHAIQRAASIAAGLGLSYEHIGLALTQHVSAMIAAQKIVHIMRPELAEALAADFTDTVKRAVPGQASSILGEEFHP